MKNKLGPIDKGLEDQAFRDIHKFLAGKPSTYRKIPRPAPATVKEVRSARRLVHATQQHFARIMGVSIETVKAWEAGKRKPEGTASKVIRLIRRDTEFAHVLEAA